MRFGGAEHASAFTSSNLWGFVWGSGIIYTLRYQLLNNRKMRNTAVEFALILMRLVFLKYSYDTCISWFIGMYLINRRPVAELVTAIVADTQSRTDGEESG